MSAGSWDILTGDRERDQRNVAILLESVEELYGPREMDDLLRHVVDRAIRVTGAQRGILVVDGPGGTPAVRMARSAKGQDLPLTLRYSRTVVESVRTGGKPHVTVDAEDPNASALGESIHDLRLLSIMAVPLMVKGRTLGVLYVDSTLQAKEFTKADLAVFRSLGGLIALALENGRLLAERVVQERMSRDIAMARQIQRGLFPKDLRMPAGFEAAGEAQPAEETSGDYYDVIPMADGRVALVMGDVTGHGLGPALIMASARATLHALLAASGDPLAVVRAMNGFLHRDLPPQAFLSFFLGVLDPAGRSLTWVNAGHNPPVLLRAGGGMQELVGTGPVLGVLGDASYRLAGPVDLSTGDVVMLYTDGVTEARNPAGEVYGEDRFFASLKTHASRTATAYELLGAVLMDLKRFAGTRAPDDDVTCLVLRAR